MLQHGVTGFSLLLLNVFSVPRDPGSGSGFKGLGFRITGLLKFDIASVALCKS